MSRAVLVLRLLAPALLAAWVACGMPSDEASAPDTDSAAEVDIEGPWSGNGCPEDGASSADATLFSGGFREIDLALSETAIAGLAHEWDDDVDDVPATVGIDGVKAEVGLKLRGGSGSFQPFDEKPAFKIDFAEYSPDARLLGLRYLLLKNMSQDDSMLDERGGLSLFAADSRPPAADSDGDGHEAPSDCDDTRPDTHPGAADPCDAHDQDCDGEWVCTAEEEAWAIARGSGNHYLSSYTYGISSAGDLNGDGTDEAWIGAQNPYDHPKSYGEAIFVSVASLPSADSTLTDEGVLYHRSAWRISPVGDVDLDGLDDVATVFMDYYGPFEDEWGVWHSDGRVSGDLEGLASTPLSLATTGMPWGLWGGDLDGDGVGEVATYVYDGSTSWHVFLPPPSLLDPSWSWRDGPRMIGDVDSLNSLGDFDGDGSEDLIVGVDFQAGQLYNTLVIAGDELRSEAVVDLELSSGRLSCSSGRDGGAARVGDPDGDGLDDGGVFCVGEGDSRLIIVGADFLGEDADEAVAYATIVGDPGEYVDDLVAAADIDGDGFGEISLDFAVATEASGWASRTALFTGLGSGGTFSPADASWAITHRLPDWRKGARFAGDLTGDGVTDLLELDAYNDLYVFSGAEMLP